LIGRVTRVERPSVEADGGIVAEALDLLHLAVVMMRTKRHERRADEDVGIVLMLLDVMRDGRPPHEALVVQAHAAQRLAPQLQCATFLPEAGAEQSLRHC